MNQLTLEFTEVEKARAKNNTDRILAMLQAGPSSSIDLINVTHRFSACVKNLRDRGWQIRVDKQEDGTSIHTLISYTPLVEVTEAMQDAYYLTEHWKLKRNERMKFDDYRCCHCKSRQLLQVHHWVYELFAESIEDLMTLCDGCHERMHKYDAIKIHFPRFVSQAIASQMTTTPRHVADEVAQ